MTLPAGRARSRCSCSAAGRSSRSMSGRCGGGARRPCATPACRWCARRCRARPASGATCRSPCSSLGARGLVVALARPVAVVSVPAGQTTIILAMDVSRSMCSTDIAPSRLQAAEAAAATFIQRQGAATQIGVVAFAGFAEMVQPPTTDRRCCSTRSQSLTTGRRTAIGSGILTAIDAIAEIDPSVAPSVDRRPARRRRRRAGPARRVRARHHRPADRRGEQRRARAASTRRSRRPTGASGSTRSGSGPTTGGELDPVRPAVHRPRAAPAAGSAAAGSAAAAAAASGAAIDEDTLAPVADATGGTYYPAESADELHTVFAEPADVPDHASHEVIEISVAFVAFGGAARALAILLGQAWRPLP